MNKEFLRAAWLLCAMTMGVVVHAQVNINRVDLIEDCAGLVTDSGGSEDGYGPDETHSVTICPPDGEETAWIEWQVFNLDPSSTISIYDGEDTFSALLAQGTNAELDGNTYVAGIGNPTGCLTITFTSGSGPDVTGNFTFSINCGQPCAVPVPVLNPTSPSPLKACPGEEIVFDGSTSFSSGTATITTWNWDWNGDQTVEEATTSGAATHTYDEPGIYRVQMSLVDDEGCESIELTNYMVHVSNEPVWGIDPLQRTACTGDEVSLNAVVTGQEFVLAPSVDFGGGLFIPDFVAGQEDVCFSSELAFTQFIPGQNIGDANTTIEQIFMNFEHSYMGDLVITFICPNGQFVEVFSQESLGPNQGFTLLGFPVDDDGQPEVQGSGFDYAWAPDATSGTWTDNAEGGGATLPEGVYESAQPFANLDGCPLNGNWQIEICDILTSDNGYVFEWGIQFADSLYPVEQSFTPVFGLECDSTYWTTADQGEHVVFSGQWDCPDVSVTMNTPGTETYTAHAVNNFGCEFTQNVTVDYVAFNATIEASSEIFCGVPVELDVVVAGADAADLTVEWDASPFLSDTLGAEVTVSGMNAPQSFQANISQAYDDFPGLLCATTSSITVGTCEIIIPNVVTPYSSSGDNDNFRIPGIQSYEDVEITILNRWGTVVFESDDFGASPAWDCAADGASSGVYFYVLTIPVEEGPLVVTDINGERVEYDGNGPFTFEGMFHLMD